MLQGNETKNESTTTKTSGVKVIKGRGEVCRNNDGLCYNITSWIILVTLTNVSTIPLEITDYDDEDFLDEIERFNDLYYGNIEVHENVDTADVNNTTESDSEGDDEGDCTDFYGNVRDIDVQEDVKLANFKDKTCGCVRL